MINDNRVVRTIAVSTGKASTPTLPGDYRIYASHGCVRQSFTVARWTYNFATVGMSVKVIARS